METELRNIARFTGTDNNAQEIMDAFRLDTFVGQAGQQAYYEMTIGGSREDSFNPFRDADMTGYEEYLDEFTSVRSEHDFLVRKAMIDENRRLRTRLDSSEAFFTRLVGNIVDPVNVVPIPMAAGLGFVKGARAAAIGGAATFAPVEAARAAIDPTNPIEEPFLAIGGGVLLGGALGGLYGAFTKRRIDQLGESFMDHANRVEHAFPIEMDAPGASASVRPIVGQEIPSEIGERLTFLRQFVDRVDGESDTAFETRLVRVSNDDELFNNYMSFGGSMDPHALMPTGIGVEQIRHTQHPWLFMKNTLFEGGVGSQIRRLADEISGSPGMYNRGNETDVATVQSVYIASKIHNVEAAKMRDRLYKAWVRHRGDDPSAMGHGVGAPVWDSMKQLVTGNLGRYAEYQKTVAEVYVRGETVDNAAIMEGVSAFKEYMDYMGREASGVGAFGPRQLKTLRRKWQLYRDQHMEASKRLEAEADLIRAHDAGEAEVLMGEAKGRMSAAERMQDKLDELENELGKFETLNAGGEIPRVKGYEGHGHMPHFFLMNEVRSRRAELLHILEDHYMKIDDVGERAQVTIDRILREGDYGTIRRNLTEAMAKVGAPEAAIKALDGQLDEIIKKNMPLREKARLATPIINDAVMTYNLTLKELPAPVQRMIRNVHDAMNKIDDMSVRGGMANFGMPTSMLSRSLDIPTQLLIDTPGGKPFIETDLEIVMRMYHRRMAPGIEMAKRYDGDPLMIERVQALAEEMDDQIAAATGKRKQRLIEEKEKLIGTPNELNEYSGGTVQVLRDKVLGVYGVPEDPSRIDVRAIQAAKSWMVLALMGKAAIAALADIGRTVTAVGIRRAVGGAFDALGMDKVAFQLGGAEVNKAGEAAELALHGRFSAMFDVDAYVAGSSAFERFLHDNVNRMFLMNLLAPYTDMMKRWSGAMIQGMMIEHAVKWHDTGRLDRSAKLDLLGVGIDKAWADRIALAWKALPEGERKGSSLTLANTDAWADKEAVQQFRRALADAVNNAVITPGPSERLNFMSTPMGSMLTQFKSFALSATHRTLAAGLQRKDQKALHGMIAMVGMGYVVDQLKSPDFDQRDMLSLDRFIQAVDYSGATGILFDINNMLEVSSGYEFGLRPLLGVESFWKDPTVAQQLGQPGGPTVSLLGDLVWSMASPDAEGSDFARSVRRLIPFNNLFWWSGLVDQVQRKVGTSLED